MTVTVDTAKAIVEDNSIIPQLTGNVSITNIIDEKESSLLLSADVDQTREGNSDLVPMLVDSPSIPLVYEKHVPNDESSIKLLGRRIVNIDHFLKNIMSVAVHAPFDCTIADMYPISEIRQGFISIIKLKCRMCNMIKVVTTDESTDNDNVNAHAVSGMLTTGGGHSQLQEICATLDMPCMDNRTWNKYHGIVSDNFHDVAWKLMSEAAVEEARIARAKGEVDKDGIPCITVVADAAWAKRSYKTKYDSLSGVAVIVGYETKILLLVFEISIVRFARDIRAIRSPKVRANINVLEIGRDQVLRWNRMRLSRVSEAALRCMV